MQLFIFYAPMQITLQMAKHYIGRAMQKRVFGYMRTAKPPTSLRIRAV